MTLKPEDAVLFYAGWEDMLFGVPTPIIVCAVLFPFKDCIITDGLVSVILVRFGGNYTRSFKEVYMIAKRNGSIIKSIQFTAPDDIPEIIRRSFLSLLRGLFDAYRLIAKEPVYAAMVYV